MDAFADFFVLPGAVPLGNGYHSAAGEAGKNAHCEVGNHTGRTHSSQSGGSHKTSHHHRIYCVVKLLEKSSEPKGKEEIQQLLPNHALRDVACLAGYTHKIPPYQETEADNECRRENSTWFHTKRQEESIRNIYSCSIRRKLRVENGNSAEIGSPNGKTSGCQEENSRGY